LLTLPLRILVGHVSDSSRSSQLAVPGAMSTQIQEKDRLDGWKAISEHLGWHSRTVMRWEHLRGLPVHRVPGGHRNAVFAFRQEIDEWLKSGFLDHNGLVEAAEHPFNGAVNGLPTSEFPAIEKTRSDAVSGPTNSSVRPLSMTNHKKVIWITGGLLLLAIFVYTVHSLAFPRQIQFTSVVQLTTDGTEKHGLVTDGRTLYFGEHQDSKIVLVAISTDGGPIRTIATPFVQAIPADISPDGKKLLVLVSDGFEVERALWVVSVVGGQPVPVGAIHCHAAAWSPDGRKIAFAHQNAIYITADGGATIREIQAFGANPDYLRWAPDGRGLRVNLRDRQSATSSFWDLTFSDEDQTQVASLVPLQTALKDCWTGSLTLDESGRSFVAGGDCAKERIFLLEKDQRPWSSKFDFVPTGIMIQNPGNLTLDSGSKKMFALGDFAGPQNATGTQRLDLFRFDMRSHEFRPFLPGVPAADVDFSRDGQWIAYVRRPDQTLWMSRANGSSARRVELQANFFELPRWSPDGRWLAFMAERPGKPWRIFVVSSSGGAPREASMGTDNQGAPTWSPDGKWLAHGDVECQETGNCAIHKIKLSTGQEFTVPGSDGLGTARWSPDGRFIAALNPIGNEVLVFDEATQRWRKLASDVNGNDLSWSTDSKYIYASRPAGNQPEILRISVKEAVVETAVDLRSFTAQSGKIDTWFALAPDDSIIFLRAMSGNEIYSLTYSEK
jgi:Tol biopolymer transport system component